ncbi:hypothetical protein FOZ62_009450, partial [Perkinsus olseni]
QTSHTSGGCVVVYDGYKGILGAFKWTQPYTLLDTGTQGHPDRPLTALQQAQSLPSPVVQRKPRIFYVRVATDVPEVSGTVLLAPVVRSGTYVAAPDVASSYLTATLDGVSANLGTTAYPWGQGYTFGICYCPGYRSCAAYQDFLQQVGTLSIWTISVCAVTGTECTDTFTGVAGGFPFTIAVNCPPLGCANSNASDTRIKIVDHNHDTGLPSYSDLHHCKTANETGELAVPQCSSPTDCRKAAVMVHGNRVFEGFSFTDWVSYSGSQRYDVCYCDGHCGSPANWHK